MQFLFYSRTNPSNYPTMLKRISIILFACLAYVHMAFAGDPFMVSGVQVDATGSNAIEAQNIAVSEGQVRAAQILLNRLTLPSQRAGQSFDAITPEVILPMIRSLEISNEKRSTQRYLGEIAVGFSQSGVQQYLTSKGMTMMSSQAEKRLVVPVLSGSSLWSENEWQAIWSSPAFQNSLTPVEVIIPSRGNDSLINASQVSAGDMTALKRLGDFFGMRRILVASAVPGPGAINVRIEDVEVNSGIKRDLGTISGADYPDAAWQVISRLEDEWKNSNASLSANAVTTNISVLYSSHNDWLWLQNVINNSAQIQGARLDALSKDGALMSLTYGGDMERLRNELSYKGVELRQDPQIGTVLFRKGRY